MRRALLLLLLLAPASVLAYNKGNFNTHRNDDGGGFVIYLDRHTVECSQTDRPWMVGFSFQRPFAVPSRLNRRLSYAFVRRRKTAHQ